MSCLPVKVIALFNDICGERYVTTDPAELYPYGKDETLDLHFPFDVLLKPSCPEEISSILRICAEHGIPVTPRGGGSGVTGGALPVRKGIVLSMERLNRIISISPEDGYVKAEAGVLTAELCRAVREIGCYFPVEPTSSASCFIGGNVALNAGSPKSCKYGKTGEYVLNLEVVLGSGEIIWTGSNSRKNSTGLNLTQLFVGSEGMLGVITKVVYRLLPPPPGELVILATFRHLHDACQAVLDIRRSSLSPSEVELIGPEALRLTADHLGDEATMADNHISAHLLIALEEQPGDPVGLDMLCAILEKYTGESILVGQTHSEREHLRRLRLHIGTAMTGNNRKYRDVDVCVPLSCLYQYIMAVKEMADSEHVMVASFGHALDGNLHTMLVTDSGEEGAMDRIDRAAHKIYAYATGIGGVISGEHGIGWLQSRYLGLQFSHKQLDLMNQLKKVFDPDGVLNPGKSFTVFGDASKADGKFCNAGGNCLER